ncbi:MAG: LysE family transporter, partial [Pseudomonadota bacterium]
MSDPAALTTALIAFAIAAGSPGPATLAVSATAMARGREAGLMLGLGLSLGLAFWGVIAATGLGALMLQSVGALILLRIAGGCYLLYLAWKSAQSALAAGDPALRAVGTCSGWRSFRQGFVLNMMNPKAVLAWLAVLAVGLPAGADVDVLATTTIACAVLGTLIYALYATLFSLPPVMAGYRRFRRWLEAGFAALFGLAGVKLLS